MRWLIVVVWASGVLQSWVGAQTSEAVPIQIGNRRQLFVDDHCVEALSGDAEVELCHPIPREIVLLYDRPWEGNVSCYTTIFKDGERYRMYYNGAHAVFYGVLGTNRPAHAEYTCMAESPDGIHWTRPNLGLVEFNGSKENNIVPVPARWTHCFTPFKDANPTCPSDERYKAVAYDHGHGHTGLHAFTSPDGLNWRMMGDGPIITEGRFDSQNLAFYDKERKLYVAYFRDMRNGVRDIATATSPDFRSWSKPQFLNYNKDAPAEHLYTNAILRYDRAPDYLFGFPMRFIDLRLGQCNLLSGVGDGVFMASRDGLNFKRWREAFKRPGRNREAWFNRCNYAAWGMIETQGEFPGGGNDLSLYYSEGFAESDAVKLRRYTIRPDGFVVARAGCSGGGLLTKPLCFSAMPKGSGGACAERRVDVPVRVVERPTVKHFGRRALRFDAPAVLEIPQTQELGACATFALTAGQIPRGAERRFFSAHDKDAVAARKLFCFHLYLAPTPEMYKHSLLRCWYSPVGKVEIKGEEFEKLIAISGSHHFAATYERGNMKLYIDGRLVAENSGGVDVSLVFTLGNLRFGNDYPPNGLFNSPFIGTADDIMIVKRALNDAEIVKLAELGAEATLNLEKENGVLYTMETGNAGLPIDMLKADGTQDAVLPTDAATGDTLLFLNCATSASGSLRAELRGMDGKPLPGYTLSDCDVIFGDDLDRAVSWRGKAELSGLADKPLRLFFELNDADLYSFRFGGKE